MPMTEKQMLARLLRCEAELEKTTAGYTPNGVHWRKALADLHAVQEELRVPDVTIPQLGPIVADDRSLLLYSLTHNTDGLRLYPAVDLGWRAGRPVLAPEDLTVTRQSSADGADAFYATGKSKLRYWIGHVATSPPNGSRFAKGQRISTIARIPASKGGPHLHVGLNIEEMPYPLGGKGEQLLYGRNGNGPDYTLGGPSLAAQFKQRAAD